MRAFELGVLAWDDARFEAVQSIMGSRSPNMVSFLNIRDPRTPDPRHQIGAGGGVRFTGVTGESDFP